MKVFVSDYDGKLTVRMKNGENGKLYTLKSDTLEYLPYTVDGSYMVFEVENGSIVRFEKSKTNVLLVVIISIVAFIVFAAIVTGIVLLIKKRRDETKRLTTIKEQ